MNQEEQSVYESVPETWGAPEDFRPMPEDFVRDQDHYSPDTANEIQDVFAFSLDYDAPIMIKTFSMVTGSFVNLRTKYTVGDLIRSVGKNSNF